MLVVTLRLNDEFPIVSGRRQQCQDSLGHLPWLMDGENDTTPVMAYANYAKCRILPHRTPARRRTDLAERHPSGDGVSMQAAGRSLKNTDQGSGIINKI